MSDPFYGTADGFTAYFTVRRNVAALALDPDTVAANLVLASEYIDGKYRASFPGLKTGHRTQIREWPRVDCIDYNGDPIDANLVPPEIENATYEVVARLGVKSVGVFTDFTPSKYSAASVSGAVSATFREINAFDIQIQIPKVDAILSTILTGVSGAGAPSGLSGSCSRG